MSEAEAFQGLTGDDGATDAREARNGLRHAASLSLTKLADGLIDPKLVLSWLLTALGAPAVFAGALVPIREAGALLPQALMAGRVARMRQRKWVWVAGAAGQGIAAAMIVFFALTLEGAAAGWAICAALAGLAVCRALCSVSFKDILGRTVGKRRRGGVTGFASSAASVGVVIFALLLIAGLVQQRGAVIAAVTLAAACWGVAALVFAFMDEPRADPEEGQGVDLSLLSGNPMLWRFVLVRGLLVSTALAPPYLVILAGGDAGQLGRLGALVLASAAASFVSSWVWGRFADRSSRRVLMATGVLGGVAMLAALALDLAGLAGTVWAMPATLFVLMVAYHGVRQGRSIYLVDVAPEGARAAWTAVANTLIGAILLAAGALAGAVSIAGAGWVLALFAAMALAAPLAALSLPEAEGA